MATLYTLAQVSEKTGFALRSLQRDARAGKFEHIHRGRIRLMTEEQIDKLVSASVTGTLPVDLGPQSDGLAAVKKILSRSKSS